MNINITESELIAYFYNECSPEVTDYIQVNLDFRADWQEYLNDLDVLRNSMDNFQIPHPTTLSIIMEEISIEENHSI